MKKIVSIFLMALYAMSVSASVVSIRSCGAMHGKLIISALESNDCCCMDAKDMESRSAPAKTAASYSGADYAGFHQTNAVSAIPCCSEILLQSRLTANQFISSEVTIPWDQAAPLLPIILFYRIDYYPARLNLPKPLSANIKPPPPAVPLYKLFQRFTYYG